MSKAPAATLRAPLLFNGRPALRATRCLAQRGFILLPVMFAISLIAALAFLLSRAGPMALQLAAGDSQAQLAQRVLQAGMQHAIWRANHSACSGYALASTPFGAHSYSAAFSAGSGSPVDITVTASLADGTTRSLIRRNVAIQQNTISVALVAAEDAEIREDDADKNRAGDGVFDVATNKPSKDRRGILRFDLTGIPLGARIVSAELTLMLKVSSGSAVPMAVRRLRQDWKHLEVTWNERQNGAYWTQAGGDPELTTVSRASVGPAKDTRYSWDVTDMVAAWVAGDYANNGLLVAGADLTASEEFYSREENDAARRPQLNVTYACDCGTVCVAPQGAGKVLLVGNAASPDNNDPYKKTLFESWGYTVTYLDDSANQAAFDSALAGNDVAYVSESVTADLAAKLLSTVKGVVYEEGAQNSVLGMATGYAQTVGANLTIVDASHPITQGFATASVAIYRHAMEGLRAAGSVAAGAQVLGRWGADAGLAVLDKGVALVGGGVAAGRRVMLPLGRDGKFNPANLNNSGRLLVQRALSWAGQTLVDPLSLGLLAHWKLDDGSGNKALDSVGSHDGDLKNGPVWGSGQLNGALNFDGINDYVEVKHDAALSLTGDFTFGAWIKPTSLSGFNVILAKGLSSSNMNYYFATNNATFRLEYSADAGTPFKASSGSLSLQTHTWQHAAVSYDSVAKQVAFYLNGAEVGRVAASATLPLANSNALTLGHGPYGNSEDWSGGLDDIRLYGRVLNGAEIMQLAAPPNGGPGGACGGTLRDEFNSISYAGSNGSLPWATDWQEVNESDGPFSGDEIVATDLSNYQLRVQDNDGGGEGVMRQADLSAYTVATLSFDYRRIGLDDANDFVAIQVSKDGGAWVELGRLAGPANDVGYSAASYDLTPYISANVRIRFVGSATLGGSDSVGFDNVQIAVSGCAP